MAGLYEPTALDRLLTGLGPFATLGLAALITVIVVAIVDLAHWALDCRASRVTTNSPAANRIPAEDGVQPSHLHPAEDPGGAGAAAVAGLRQPSVPIFEGDPNAERLPDLIINFKAWKDERGVIH